MAKTTSQVNQVIEKPKMKNGTQKKMLRKLTSLHLLQSQTPTQKVENAEQSPNVQVKLCAVDPDIRRELSKLILH